MEREKDKLFTEYARALEETFQRTNRTFRASSDGGGVPSCHARCLLKIDSILSHTRSCSIRWIRDAPSAARISIKECGTEHSRGHERVACLCKLIHHRRINVYTSRGTQWRHRNDDTVEHLGQLLVLTHIQDRALLRNKRRTSVAAAHKKKRTSHSCARSRRS